ncbi:D-alanyl-D-alanine carboxypeptidase family protein [Clostridiisalibacter paucivorans]|uniref:D-alanyl-D-alanine carboxypeptidase family protein n=1 Tax=Clostridiisalibacter paucivorans TaxID=408753 RepID=UPI0005585499|nr:D-alanyl-D-alanine carboxypeptidase family protein [Clostridiisalibacter paucivorans]
MKIFNNKYFIICVTIIILMNISIANIYAMESTPFELNCKSAILVDANTGKVIYEKDSHKKLEPASITKVMVLLLTMESIEQGKISLQDKVVISPYASSMGGSQVYLEPNGVNTVEDLLKAVCLRSANDASVALGEHIAGNNELFVKMMNDRAKDLNMKNTNFENPTGLPHENHYTSAYDISLMSKELLKHTMVHQWLTKWMDTIHVGKNNDVEQQLVNTNRLIKNYKGANGIKTGFTQSAGYCLAASAKRENLNLISVVLGCDTSNNRFKESIKLLDYGFANYESTLICNKGDIIKQIPIEKGKKEKVNILAKDDLYVLVKKGSNKKFDKEIILPEYIKAPLKSNDIIGEMVIKENEILLGKVNLTIDEDIPKANPIDMLNKIYDKYISTN